MNGTEQATAIEKLTGVLDELKIEYAIGGSVASSVYGAVRFTQDVDVTVQLFLATASRFYERVKQDFYISEEAMYEALRSGGSFNVIHLQTVFKIDIFLQGRDEYQRQMLSRRRKLQLADGVRPLSFVSPEDIVLLKLDWYRRSDCTSDRQWSDVLGVLAVQKHNLDFDYLRDWAGKLGLKELLEKAVSDSQM